MKDFIPSARPGMLLTDQWLNRGVRILNQLSGGSPAGRGVGGYFQTFWSAGFDPKNTLLRQFIITDVEDMAQGLYKGVDRYWNITDEQWNNNSEGDQTPITIDAFAYGVDLILIINDVVTCYWHEQRGAYIPINPPLRRQVVADDEVAINSSGTFSIWKWNGAAMVDTGFDLTAHNRWLHNSDPSRAIRAGSQAIVQYYVESGVYMIETGEGSLLRPVQVYSQAIPAGNPVYANASGLIPGRTIQYSGGSLVADDNCWILFIDNRGLIAATLPGISEDYHIGYPAGTATVGVDSRPLYLVQRAGKPIFWLYLLNEDFGGSLPDQANCSLLTLRTAVDTTVDVTLYSAPSSMFDSLQAGDRALGFEQDGLHYCVQAPC